MDFRALRYFVAVYEEQSLSAASKRCYVSQPTITTALQQLEAELGCLLFVRHSKGVTPSTDGRRLYSDACRIIDEVEQTRKQFQMRSEKVSLTLALMPFLSGKYVSRIIKALIKGIPGLDLLLLDTNSEADARVISNTILGDNEAFHKLWVDRYVLAMPLEHSLGRTDKVLLDQLNNLPFVSRKPCDITDAWQHAVQKRGINLNIKATVKTEEYALDLVAAGLGVSIVPRHSTDGRVDLLTREVDDLNLERLVGLAYNKDKPLSAELLLAINCVTQEFE